ncbi:MAG: TerB family tellurite resistance protein [Leptospiraceae bacterium]|nr:TerB family tellurite resistance protein [Leptospiraceae bacterium]MCB1303258.1 TerB family tellurite resistance protein [Leptospiraceae bacterium]
MFDGLGNKLKSFLNPANNNPVARHFREPEFVQDNEHRTTQVLFLKLLMAVARKDGHIDPEEFELLQDYAFSNALNETEWREIQFYAHANVEQKDLEPMIADLISEIRSRVQKEDLLQAVRDMVAADGRTEEGEKELLELLQSRLEGVQTSILDNTVRSLGRGLRNRKANSTDENARLYALNPVAGVLKQEIPYQGYNHDIIGAKLGLMLVLIHADDTVEGKELKEFARLVGEQLGKPAEEIETLAAQLTRIPAGHFEISHLSRLLVENLSEEQRINWMAALFRMAHADGIFHEEEDRHLRLISRFLLLSTPQFLEARKLATGK